MKATRTGGLDPQLTRRSVLKAGGALLVSVAWPIPTLFSASAPDAATTTMDPTQGSSWIEVHADNTITARTGRTEIGVGISAYYAQVIAEELSVRPESVSLIMGDTDRTPDGGCSAGLLIGATSLRKVAAYTYLALRQLAAQELGVSEAELTASQGGFVVTGAAGRTVAYGDLVRGKQLEVTIPVSGGLPKINPNDPTGVDNLVGYTVAGDPPVKPSGQYTVVGTSYPMPGIRDKVTGKTIWSCDIGLPGMLHARMVRPATLGSTLISVGAVDKQRFPTADVVTKGNLVAVISPNEWEAIAAAQVVATRTQWTAWAGLPSSDNLVAALQAHQWGEPTASRGDSTKVSTALSGATKIIAASYSQPYVRHAPIGPYVAVADVRRDGFVSVWTHSSNSQGLRAQIANTLGTTKDQVVVRWLDQAGQYGRTTYGGDGAEADAAILSQLVGKPVRVQWMLQEDLAWSTVSPGWVADVKAGLDESGKLVAFQHAWYAPHQRDARLLGAVLAGLPTVTPKHDNSVGTVYPYDQVPAFEQAFSTANLGADSTSVGLRGHIMRTPWQRQQNFVLESTINEAAAMGGADPIQFRLDHTTNQRMIEILRKTAAAANWVSRSSPQPKATRRGVSAVSGRGVAIVIRDGACWAGIAEIEVIPDTGRIHVVRFTVGVDAGKVLNPRQLTRIAQGGVVMGVGEALKEEVTFDRGKVTSTDWRRYRILTMAETPDIQVVQTSRDDVRPMGGGEAPNALAPPAVAAAFFDATGVYPRRIPLTPQYVQSLLKT